MSDPMDTKLRELTYRLVAMAPEAPPFPEEPMVQLKPAPSPAAPARRRTTPLAWLAAAAAVTLLVVGLPLFLSRGDTTPTVPPASESTLPGDGSTTPPTTAPASGSTTVPFTVYLYSNEITTPNGQAALVAVQRTGEVDFDVVENRIVVALESLVTDQVPAGFSSAIPSGIGGIDVSFAEGIVTFEVAGAFSADAETAELQQRLGQVVFTATQFPEVRGVVFTEGGQPIEPDVLTREGFFDVAQAIYVDTPAVGATVASPFRIAGTANVFEATLQYEILTDAGETLASGFTTATCGTGCWGDFDLTGTFELDADTTGFVNVYVFSAEDGSRQNVITYRVQLLATDGAPPATVPPTTVPPVVSTLPAGGASFDVDPSTVPATPVQGTVVVDAPWGAAPDELGLIEEKGFGPCCFAVAGDGTIVVNDSQNARLVVYPPTGEPSVLATFDPADFVAENVAIDAFGRLYVIGLTNRPDRPYDLIVLDLATGEQLARTETSLDINTDLEASNDGGVYAGVPSSQFTWVKVAADGVPLGAGGEQAFNYLPGETSLTVYYDAGVEIVVLPAGDSPATTYDVPSEQYVWDVLTVPGAPDANGVVVWLTPELGGADPSTLLFIGTDDGELATTALSIGVPRAVELGSFNTMQYAFGGIYVLGATADGAQIVRYELP